MKVLNQNQLVDLLEGKTAHTFIGIETETIPELTVKDRITKVSAEDTFGCSKQQVKKITMANVGLGYDYRSLIVNRLKKEGKSESEYVEGKTWHMALDGTKNMRVNPKTGELYVWVFYIANNIPKTCFYNSVTGTEINKALLTNFLPKESTADNQGLSEGNEIVPRLYKLESIKKITIDKEEYIIK